MSPVVFTLVLALLCPVTYVLTAFILIKRSLLLVVWMSAAVSNLNYPSSFWIVIAFIFFADFLWVFQVGPPILALLSKLKLLDLSLLLLAFFLVFLALLYSLSLFFVQQSSSVWPIPFLFFTLMQYWYLCLLSSFILSTMMSSAVPVLGFTSFILCCIPMY